MILSSDLIKKLKKDSDFKEFQNYILEEISKLDSLGVFDITASNEQLGAQVRARIIARDKLYEILKPVVDFQEKKEPTKEQIEKTEEKYGL